MEAQSDELEAIQWQEYKLEFWIVTSKPACLPKRLYSINSNVNLDPLIKMVSAQFSHFKVATGFSLHPDPPGRTHPSLWREATVE